MVDCWSAFAFGQIFGECDAPRRRVDPPQRPAYVRPYTPPESRTQRPVTSGWGPVQVNPSPHSAQKPVPKIARAECIVPNRIALSGYVVIVFRDYAPRTQCVAAYRDGELLRMHNGTPMAGYASTGTRGEHETPLTSLKNGPHEVKFASRYHRSSLYDDAPMPFALFFNGNIALHEGATHRERLSHGCVRLPHELASAIWSSMEHMMGRRIVSHDFKIGDPKFQVIVTTTVEQFAREWNTAYASVSR